MPKTYTLKTVDSVSAIAESLKNAAAHFEKAASQMKDNRLNDAFLPWCQRHDNLIQILVEVAAGGEMAIESQVSAKRQGIQSRFYAMKERSARDVAARRERTKDQPRRPRGRPRKDS